MDIKPRIFLTDQIPMNKIVEEKLSKLCGLPDVSGVAVFPDVHAKPDNPFPTGIAVATKNTIYPSVIGQDIGCAMMVWHCHCKADNLNPDLIKKMFNRMIARVSDSKPNQRRVKSRTLEQMIFGGGDWATGKNFITPREQERLERNGQFLIPKERHLVRDSIPRDAWKGGMNKLNSIGGGNHFLELQKITEIYDEDAAKQLGLEKDDLLIWIHTGSSSLGKRLENYYTNRWNTDLKRRIRQKWRSSLFHLQLQALGRFAERWKLIKGKSVDQGIDADSPEGKRYLIAHQAAMNFAVVNRILLAKIFEIIMKEEILDAKLEILADVAHESIQKEKLPEGEFWVHRCGASRAVPPERWSDPWGNGLGQLLPLPGSLGTSSYLAVAQSNVNNSYWAVNHGAGRQLEKTEARNQIPEDTISKYRKMQGERIFYAGKGEDLTEQIPDAFKDISQVAEAIETHNLAKMVAQCEPIASLKA